MSQPKFFRKEDISGKTVIDSSGRVTGKVKDILFSLDGSVSLVVGEAATGNVGGGEVRIPLKRVVGLSEFVVTRDDDAVEGEPGPVMQQSHAVPSCKFCGAELTDGTIYCPSCGRSQV